MNRYIITIITLIYGCSALANGDPVMQYSSINRVANPEPLTISGIHIVSESINIKHENGYNCFDVTYNLQNSTDTTYHEIHYGFPIDYLDSADGQYRTTDNYRSESRYETGWTDNLVKDVTFTLDNKPLKCRSATESVRSAGFEIEEYDLLDDSVAYDSIPIDAVDRIWYYTEFGIAAHAQAILNVRYKVYQPGQGGLYSDYYNFSMYPRIYPDPYEFIFSHPHLMRYFTQYINILYDLRPARHFGNDSIHQLTVNIDISNLTEPKIYDAAGWQITSESIQRIYNDFIPSKSNPIYLQIHHSPTKDRKYVQQTIDALAIPAEQYSIKRCDDSTLLLEFTDPRFISEIAVDIDTTLIRNIQADIIHKDGRTRQFRYEKTEDKYRDKYDDRLSSPCTLTITDCLFDSFLSVKIDDTNYSYIDKSDFGSDWHKIRSIRLSFDPAAPAPDRIRPIDSRYPHMIQ